MPACIEVAVEMNLLYFLVLLLQSQTFMAELVQPFFEWAKFTSKYRSHGIAKEGECVFKR